MTEPNPTSSNPPELLWSKFQPLLGSDLKVGVETVFDINARFDAPEYLDSEKKMITRYPPGEIQHLFHPSFALGEDLRTEDEMRMAFVPQVDLSSGRFHRITLFRKDRGGETPWAVAARFSNEVSEERMVFGFSSVNSRNDYYLRLALPGKALDEKGKPEFLPVYVKIEIDREKDEFIYIAISAEVESDEETSKEVGFFVFARKVGTLEVPEVLRKAKPTPRFSK